jgi:hypothetical protein
MRCAAKTRKIPNCGLFRTVEGFSRFIACLLLMSVMLGACGSGVPAAKVAEGFFDAIHDADSERFKGLLDADTKEKFEASMDNAELAAYLKEADDSLRSLYGDDWRSRIHIDSAKPGAMAEGTVQPDVKTWDVAVSIRGEQDGGQMIRVLEKDGLCYLDLSTMEGLNADK